MKTIVVNIRASAYDILITRKTRFGNPYILNKDGNRDEVCELHYEWLMLWVEREQEIIISGFSNKWQVEHLHLLIGKCIGCVCVPMRCHGTNFVKLIKILKI